MGLLRRPGEAQMGLHELHMCRSVDVRSAKEGLTIAVSQARQAQSSVLQALC